MNTRLLIFYDYFYPGYKAGGPIQSLTNLVLSLQQDYAINVVTSSYDLSVKTPYDDVLSNTWVKVKLPGSQQPVNVLYLDGKMDSKQYQQLILEVNAPVVYFNNIYSATFFRDPLSFFKVASQSPKIVICPRGMLQKGALAVKPIKKKIYLSYLRITGKLHKAYWHATNREELEDIQEHFPINAGITIAENIPKPPYQNITSLDKQPGTLRLVFLSLITEKKNLLHLLKVLQQADKRITLDIYGPVKDEAYWKTCLELIKALGSRVQYKGDVVPIHVQETISQYHALILLTKGENFGHALYESLSVGRPIITSPFTPWVNLQEKQAGWNVEIDKVEAGVSLLNELFQLNTIEFEKYYLGAHKMAVDYFNQLDSKASYDRLFKIDDNG